MLSSVEEINMFKILKRLLKKSDAENKSLSDEYLEIVRKFGELGINITDCLKLELEVLEKIYVAIVSLYKKYPEIPVGYIEELNLQKIKEGIADTHFFSTSKRVHYDKASHYNTNRGLCISLNKEYFVDISKFAIKMELVNLSIDCVYEYAIAHEFGHCIDILMAKECGFLKQSDALERKEVSYFLNNLPVSYNIVSEIIYNKFPKRNRSYISVGGELSNLMGETASMNEGEAFAEAVAFDYFNLDNSTAKEILDNYHIWLEEKRRS